MIPQFPTSCSLAGYQQLRAPVLNSRMKSFSRYSLGWFSSLAILLSAVAVIGAEPKTISYYREIRPIFQASCHGCHQPAKPGGEYVMTDFAAMTAGGESTEVAITPGKPEESNLIAQITPTDGSAEMPKSKPPLSEQQRDLVAEWIRQGAKDDTPLAAKIRYDAEHPPQYTGLPTVTSVDWSPDGSLLAVSAYHEVLLFETNAKNGYTPAARLVGLSERIEKVTFSPNGERLAVAGGNPGRMGELQVWNVKTKKLEFSLNEGYDTIYGVSWSPDGKSLSFGCPDNTVRIVDAATGKQNFFNGAHDDWVLDTVFSVKGDHLITVSRDRSMKLMKVDTQRFIDNITSITPGALKGGLASVDRHPTQEQLLVGGADGIPKIYKMFRDKARKIGDDFNLIRKFAALPGRLTSVAYNKAGSQIVAGSSHNGQGQVRVFNEADGKEIAKIEIPESAVYSVAFRPDGAQLAASGFDGMVRIYNAQNGEKISEFPVVALPQ